MHLSALLDAVLQNEHMPVIITHYDLEAKSQRQSVRASLAAAIAHYNEHSIHTEA